MLGIVTRWAFARRAVLLCLTLVCALTSNLGYKKKRQGSLLKEKTFGPMNGLLPHYRDQAC
jgi:hypothetical protein